MKTQRLKINKAKLRKIAPTTNAFLSLARAIVYQQISTAAGNSIFAKFLDLFKKHGVRRPQPETFLTFSIAELKSAGISPQKAGYLKDLSEKFVSKSINHKKFHTMTDAEVKEHLLLVKGIGPWTADMFLIFALNRPDILPVGDLGTRKGFMKAFGLKKMPSEKEMLRLAEPHNNGEWTNLTLHLWGILED